MTDQDRERSLDETQPLATQAEAGGVPAADEPVPATPDATAPVTPEATIPAPPAVVPAPPPAAVPAPVMTPAPPTTGVPVPQAAAAAAAGSEATPWWAESTPVQPVASPRRRGGARWAIAGMLIVAVVAVAAAATMLLTGSSAEPEAYAYFPQDTAMVMEVRPDLPGAQRENVGRLLSKFPGFADQSTIDTKIDEAIDRFVDMAAGTDVDYQKVVKPFLAGPVVVGVTKVPEDSSTSPAEGFLWVATTDGSLACGNEPFANVVETVEHAGKTISVVDRDGGRIGCLVNGRTVLLGGVDDVKAALDTKAGSTSLAADPALDKARAALGGDTLGLVYFSASGLDQLSELAGRQQTEAGMAVPEFPLPTWFAVGVRAEPAGLVTEMVGSLPGGDGAGPLPSLPAPKVSTLATKLPGTTIAALEAHQLGTTVTTTLDQLKQDPELADGIEQLEGALALMGGADGVFGWMGDATVVVTRDGDEFGGGLVIETSDESRAASLVTQLRAALAFAGAQGITVTDAPYGDGTITTVSIDAAAFGEMPTDGPFELPKTLDIDVTVQHGLLIIGAGNGFVESVVDAAPGGTLADQPRYQAAMALAGTSNSGQVYLDVAAGVSIVEDLVLPMAGPDAETEWRRDVAPFVEPLDAVAMSTTMDGDLLRVRVVFTAHEAQQ